MKWGRAAFVVMICASVANAAAAPLASASFAGDTNGTVAFAAICDGNIGQALYSVNPNGSPPPTYTCPGGAAPNYTQSTAGAADSMPYFASDGQTLYFASNRAGTFALYRSPYPGSVSGSPGSQVDLATLVVDPGGMNDYAPSVSNDGSLVAFIRCDASGASCHLMTVLLSSPGAPVQASPTLLRAPDPVSGAANRPELDPVDATKVLYVDTASHIHLLDLSSSADRDLSAESGVGSAKDEYPDWKPDGTKIVFDSTRPTGGPAGNTIWTMTVGAPATATSLWGTNDPGKEIEPVYAPAGSGLVWTKLGTGSNIVEYSPNARVSNATDVVNLTNNRSNNSQPAWQPIPASTQVPEFPWTVSAPGTALLLGAVARLRHRRSALG